MTFCMNTDHKHTAIKYCLRVNDYKHSYGEKL